MENKPDKPDNIEFMPDDTFSITSQGIGCLLIELGEKLEEGKIGRIEGLIELDSLQDALLKL